MSLCVIKQNLTIDNQESFPCDTSDHWCHLWNSAGRLGLSCFNRSTKLQFGKTWAISKNPDPKIGILWRSSKKVYISKSPLPYSLPITPLPGPHQHPLHQLDRVWDQSLHLGDTGKLAMEARCPLDLKTNKEDRSPRHPFGDLFFFE